MFQQVLQDEFMLLALFTKSGRTAEFPNSAMLSTQSMKRVQHSFASNAIMQGSFELITQGTVSRLKLGAMSKRKLKMWPNRCQQSK